MGLSTINEGRNRCHCTSVPGSVQEQALSRTSRRVLRVAEDAKTKQPFAIPMKDGSPYAFAGLWERWKDPVTKQRLETFSVITTDRNELIEPMHNRMPLILRPKD
jgi:hypothetical protein